MNHRIFIAINLPENLRKKLSDYQEKWPELPARWTKTENLHITLLFIGSVADQEIAEICQISKEVALRHPMFSISLNKICYGPPNKMPRSPDESRGGWRGGWSPRMVWIEGEKSEELARLQKDLENSLFSSPFNNAEARYNVKGDISGKARYKGVIEPEARAFAPHITLGRIRQWEFRRIEPEERPEVEEDVSLNLEVDSIEVMESRLKKGGPEYTILESCPLSS